MKKFAFRYERILEVKISIENGLKNKLGEINKSILEKEKELSDVLKENEEYLKYLEDMMKTGVRAGDLRAIEHNKEYLTNKIADVKYNIRILVNKRIEIQKELVEANKQRKIMEKLKEKELNEYKELELVEDKKIIDEIVTYTSTRKRGE